MSTRGADTDASKFMIAPQGHLGERKLQKRRKPSGWLRSRKHIAPRNGDERRPNYCEIENQVIRQMLSGPSNCVSLMLYSIQNQLEKRPVNPFFFSFFWLRSFWVPDQFNTSTLTFCVNTVQVVIFKICVKRNGLAINFNNKALSSPTPSSCQSQ